MAITRDSDRQHPQQDPATAAGRLRAGRVPLIASLAVLLAGTLVWQVPLTFAIGGFVAIVAVTAFAPRRPRTQHIGSASRDEPVRWPDTSTKSTVDALRNPAFILDGAGVIRFANKAAARRFPDTRPGDLLALTFRSPDLVEALRAAAGGVAGEVQYRERGENAASFNIEIDMLGNPAMPSHFLLVTLNDVSQQIALGRMRADFVANASHELRTPLTSLTGFVETLLGPARDDRDASDKFLRIMLEQAERMRRLIDDLLSLSRLEMRAHNPPSGSVDLRPLLNHVCDTLAPLAEENGIKIHLSLPDGDIRVVGDADELTQVFQNIVENGLKYGEAGKKLDIAVKLTAEDDLPSRVFVSVRDYGPGIAAEHLPRLTERFYRVDVETSRQKQGTGLGLAIVKHILAHHRGHLRIESRRGEGATFTVELPAKSERTGI